MVGVRACSSQCLAREHKVPTMPIKPPRLPSRPLLLRCFDPGGSARMILPVKYCTSSLIELQGRGIAVGLMELQGWDVRAVGLMELQGRDVHKQRCDVAVLMWVRG